MPFMAYVMEVQVKVNCPLPFGGASANGLDPHIPAAQGSFGFGWTVSAKHVWEVFTGVTSFGLSHA